jgi:hypothetical protein
VSNQIGDRNNHPKSILNGKEMQTLGIGLLMKTEVFTKLEGRRGEEV